MRADGQLKDRLAILKAKEISRESWMASDYRYQIAVIIILKKTFL